MREFLEVDWELSKRIAKRIDLVPNGCWRNSMLAQRKLFGSIYVEGWAIAQPFSMVYEHGWVEYEGKIVDVSWSELRQCPIAYFSGVRYNREQAQYKQRQRLDLPFAGHLPKSPDSYQLAYAEATLYSIEQNDIVNIEIVAKLSAMAQQLRKKNLVTA